MTLNKVLITGVICFQPKVKQLGAISATSAQLDIGARHGDVQLYGLAESATRLAQLRPGQQVKIAGKLSISPNGLLQVRVEDVVLLETRYKQIETGENA